MYTCDIVMMVIVCICIHVCCTSMQFVQKYKKCKLHVDAFQTGSGVALSFAYYGQGTGFIWLDDVGCVGTEARLWDCANSGIGIHNCDHSEDASVQCTGLFCSLLGCLNYTCLESKCTY